MKRNFLVILDLDNTLIDTTTSPVPGQVPSDKLNVGKLGVYYSYPRPHLDTFMAYLTSKYHVGIWTAALPIWKNRVVNTTLNKYKPNFLFMGSGKSVVYSLTPEVGSVIKPLTVVWKQFPKFGPENTLIIDDTKSTGSLNPKNHLHIKPFYAVNAINDKELIKIIGILESSPKLNPPCIKIKYEKTNK